MSNDADQAIQEMAVALAQGVDLYAVIGKLYVENLTKQQAIALAVQSLQAFKPQSPAADADHTNPSEGFDPAGPTPEPKRPRVKRR